MGTETHTHTNRLKYANKIYCNFCRIQFVLQTCCIGNYFKPLRKNIHGLRCIWVCLFFGEKVRDNLWEE